MEAHTTHGTAESAREPCAGSPGVHAVLDVLESLGESNQLSLAELTRRLGLPKTSVHRVCGALVERGWLLRDASGVYSLGIRALGVGAAAAELPIVVAFRPVAAELLARHNETISLTLLDGDDSLFVAKAETTHPVRLVTAVGSRLPAFAAAQRARPARRSAGGGDRDRVRRPVPRDADRRGSGRPCRTCSGCSRGRAMTASPRTSRRPRSGCTASRFLSATAGVGSLRQ